mgnify:CR=1 FL=1
METIKLTILTIIMTSSAFYVASYNKSVISGDFPALGEAWLATISAGIFLSTIIYILKLARDE